MHVLDCGCGPGGISIGLARFVGHVTGIDIQFLQFTCGRQIAAEKNADNIDFAAADVYKLPFPDNHFDAVLMHAVLYHMDKPLDVLREMCRVLKPGGVIGVRDAIANSTIVEPLTPVLERAEALMQTVLHAQSGTGYTPEYQESLLQNAGYVNIITSMSYDRYEKPEQTRRVGEYLSKFILEPHIAQELNVSREELEAISAAYFEWGQHPGARCIRPRAECVGWKPG